MDLPIFTTCCFNLCANANSMSFWSAYGGIGVSQPDAWEESATQTLEMMMEFFPKAQFLALDQRDNSPIKDDRITYSKVDFDDPDEIADAIETADVVIDDATHASHHQQNAIRALFPKLNSGGLYIAEDLRGQPKSLEKQNSVKTAALFQGYLETGIFEHPDEETKTELNELRADISGCFVFQARFQKHRRDQILVLHKR